jgi:hypothetical protein
MGKFFKGNPPFKTCPRCHRDKFGVLNVGDSSYTRRCSDCDFDAHFSLPKPRKKIIYLDQFAISLMVKVPFGRTPNADHWIRLRNVLERAIEWQAIVCPHSDNHERESWLDNRLGPDYENFYRHLSLNRSFKSPFDIQSFQIYDALRIFENDSPCSSWPRWHYFLENDPDVWHDFFYMTVNLNKTRQKDLNRQAKNALAEQTRRLTDYFRTSGKSFEDQYKLEVNQQGKNIVLMYTRDEKRRAESKTPEELAEALMEGSIYSETVRHIMRYLTRCGYSDENLATRTVDFLFSPVFKDINVVRLTAALWAGIARKVSLKEAEVKASDYNDVELISHYGPYCDAMLIDRRMKDLLLSNPVKDKVCLATKFFSAGNLNELCDFIEKSIDHIPLDVAQHVPDVYMQ